MNEAPPKPKEARVWRLPAGIWVLGAVSMLMDISSEMIHALLPVYLMVGLGTTALTVGIIEGIAEATAAITKVFSGALSDRIGKRKELAALGYGLAALSKPIFPLAPSVPWLVAARFIDRVGKGVREAPRDALLADLSPDDMHGASFGLRQSLDTIGAFVGPLAAIGLMWLFANDFTSVFWIAVVPALLAFLLIVVAVHEPKRPEGRTKIKNPLSSGELSQLGVRYWAVVAVAAMFTLARFSEAFLILRAESMGVPLMMVPLALVVMNIAYALSAYPVGALSDRTDRRTLLIIGLILLVIADLVLAFAPGFWALGVGISLWGLHMGFTQGLLAALVADVAPARLRGTAYGVLNLITGVALLAASVIAGAIWETYGASWTFTTGALFAAATIGGLLLLKDRIGPNGAAHFEAPNQPGLSHE